MTIIYEKILFWRLLNILQNKIINFIYIMFNAHKAKQILEEKWDLIVDIPDDQEVTKFDLLFCSAQYSTDSNKKAKKKEYRDKLSVKAEK